MLALMWTMHNQPINNTHYLTGKEQAGPGNRENNAGGLVKWSVISASDCDTRSSFITAMFLLLLLALLCPVTASPVQTSSLLSCDLELAMLRRSIQDLENQLLVGAWQIDYLRTHKPFATFQLPSSSVDPVLKPDRSSAEDFSPGPLPVLPPAGSVVVQDKDCSELYDRLKPPSGFYRIKPKLDQEPFLVYCDMEDGGGWTVFQKRRHGRVDFNRDWVDYREGFGDFKLWNDEFWLGNEHIHSLLSEGRNLVKIDLMDWKGERSHAFYENFRISDEEDRYRLQFGMYSGRAGNALAGGRGMVEQWSACLSGMQFSTRDQDNDRFLQGSCAQENKAGWWFNRCHTANLNGKFYHGGEYIGPFDNGVVWGTWKGLWYSLRHTAMKVRPLLFLDSVGSGAGENE